MRNRGFNYQQMLWKLRPELAAKIRKLRKCRAITCSDLFPSNACCNPPARGKRHD